LGLLLKEPLTSTQLKTILQVSDFTLSNYLRTLEKQGKIEFTLNPEDRRSKRYSIKPESKDQIEIMINKQELQKLVSDLALTKEKLSWLESYIRLADVVETKEEWQKVLDLLETMRREKVSSPLT